MNYIMLLAAVTWFMMARKRVSGSEVKGMMEEEKERMMLGMRRGFLSDPVTYT